MVKRSPATLRGYNRGREVLTEATNGLVLDRVGCVSIRPEPRKVRKKQEVLIFSAFWNGKQI